MFGQCVSVQIIRYRLSVWGAIGILGQTVLFLVPGLAAGGAVFFAL